MVQLGPEGTGSGQSLSPSGWSPVIDQAVLFGESLDFARGLLKLGLSFDLIEAQGVS